MSSPDTSHNFQASTALMLMLTKLSTKTGSKDDSMLQALLQALSMTLKVLYSKLTAATAPDPGLESVASTVYDMAEAITNEERPRSSVMSFLQEYSEDLIRVLEQIRVNVDSGHYEALSQLVAEIIVMEKVLLSETDQKGDTPVESDTIYDDEVSQNQRQFVSASSSGEHSPGALQTLVDGCPEYQASEHHISTFVVYTPSDASSTSSGATTALPQEEIETLESQFPDGGTIISVHYPYKAVVWIERHYDHPLLAYIRSRNLGGPIALMLSAETPALAIFGSILDVWVLRAAKLLSDLSKFAVMIRPLADNPFPDWAARHDQSSMQSVNPFSQGTQPLRRTAGKASRLRGGASESENEETRTSTLKKGPTHWVDVRLELSGTGTEYRVRLTTQLQFTTQEKNTDEHRVGNGDVPEIISWTRVSVTSDEDRIIPDRSYSAAGFVVYGQKILSCNNMDCEEFAPPNQTINVTETETTQKDLSGKIHLGAKPIAEIAAKKGKMKAKAVQNVNDRITPKCIVRHGRGQSWARDSKEYDSLLFSYESAPDLTSPEKGKKHPMIAEFSIGINVVNPEDPTSKQLPELTSFIARNQNNLWIEDDLLKSRGQGILVLTSTYIQNVQTPTALCVIENPKVVLGDTSLTDPPPTDTTPAPYNNDAAMAVAIEALSRSTMDEQPGLRRKITQMLGALPLFRRRQESDTDLPRLRLHEFIARGWDDTKNEWRRPIYPTLDANFHKAADASTSRWKVVVDGAKEPASNPHADGGIRAVPLETRSSPIPDDRMEIDESDVMAVAS
ncbi:hypothetical protein C8J57DRAFT_1336234 [Mycena rebaudengoi]|nr:hypothetical protein C8J57DRAFT_1336234 [Mycena rebaudengoi]